MRFEIKQQSFFNNGQLLLPLLKDNENASIEDKVKAWLERDYALTFTSRAKGIGISAGDLNKALRATIQENIIGVHGETFVEDGAFFHQGIHGFDFSLYDEQHNIIRIRNNYIGDPGRFDGEAKLLEINKQAGYSKRDWKSKIDKLGGDAGKNLPSSKTRLTIVGELQFGNWALVKHDLLRLLNSSDSLEIDYYIYIAPTGRLADLLSDGIVTYDSVINAIQENHRIIKTPLWIIGLDCSDAE